MRKLCVNDYVRLTRDVPEMDLHRGEVGVIRSTWFEPTLRYDVEFHPPGEDQDTRCLLNPDQVEPQDR